MQSKTIVEEEEIDGRFPEEVLLQQKKMMTKNIRKKSGLEIMKELN